MATSNSYNFAVTRLELITDALLHISGLGTGESPSATEVTEASRLLNMLMKLRASDGMPLWSIKRGVILPVTGTSTVSTVSHIVQSGSYVQTAVSGNEAASQTIITVDSISGISNADQIGIELDDGTMHWTTVNGAPAGSDVTITTALPSAASDENKVYAYTASSDRIPRPIRVISANILETTDSNGWEIDVLDHQGFYEYNDRTLAGPNPTVLYYEATLGDNTADPTSSTTWYGNFHVYPRFLGGDHVIEFSYQRPFQDVDSDSDHLNFPQEFYLPLMLELAALLGPRHNVPIEERRALFSEAKVYREEALTTVSPEGSLLIEPGQRWQ